MSASIGVSTAASGRHEDRLRLRGGRGPASAAAAMIDGRLVTLRARGGRREGQIHPDLRQLPPEARERLRSPSGASAQVLASQERAGGE